MSWQGPLSAALMSAFGYSLASATQRDRDLYNHPRGSGWPATWPAWGCCWMMCHRPEVVFVARYTGGKEYEKFFCEEHGRKFAARRGLAVPDAKITGIEEASL
jgi:hypothetical protein